MLARIFFRRINQWSFFSCSREFDAFVFNSIASTAREQKIVPINSKFVKLWNGLWLEMFDVRIVNVLNLTFAISTFPVK